MKNLIGLILFFSLTINNNLLSQEEKIFHTGFSIFPQINIPKFEKPDIGIGKNTFGIKGQFDIYYDVSSRVQINSGVNINLLKTSTIDYSPTLDCDFDGTSADLTNSWYEDRYEIIYLEIPIESRIKLLGNENHLYAKIGIELRFKINQNSESVLVECGTNELSLESNIVNEPTNFVFASNFGIGYEIKITKKLKLFFEPEMGYTWTSIYNEAGIIDDLTNNVKVLDFGLRMGIRN